MRRMQGGEGGGHAVRSGRAVRDRGLQMCSRLDSVSGR